MSLLEQCSNLQKRVDHLKELQKSVAETDALLGRLSEARETKKDAQEAVAKIHLLKSSNIQIDLNSILQIDPLTPLSKIIGRFNEKPEAASLVKFKDWNHFQERSRDWQKALVKEAVRSWKAYIDQQTQGQSPEKLKVSLAQTASNKRALKAFSIIYDALQCLKNEFPENSEKVEEADALSEELKRTSSGFDFDVHAEVKAFLVAIQQGGAPLELLTNEVLTWLHENNSEHQFQIVGNHL